MIMRATQKKMMSKPVTSTEEGRKVSRSCVFSGQPSEENGTSCEENQVSSTSSSRVSFVPSALCFCASSSRARDEDLSLPRRTRRESGGPTTAGARCTSPGCSPASGCRCEVQCSGKNFTSPLGDRLQARLRHAVHLHEPLVGEHRLDDHAGAAGARHAQLVGLFRDQQVLLLADRRGSSCARRSGPGRRRPVPLGDLRVQRQDRRSAAACGAAPTA